jgi:hypothetical protein
MRTKKSKLGWYIRISVILIIAMILVPSISVMALTGESDPMEGVEISPPGFTVSSAWSVQMSTPIYYPIPPLPPPPVPLSPKIFILVDAMIYPQLAFHIDRYMDDIVSEDNFLPELHIGTWTSEMQVRSLLRDGYTYHNLAGALLVGDIPVAYYEMRDILGPKWDYGWAEFPFDVYYTDLDGTWIDSDYNGIYDDHIAGSGDLQPEIFVGRLYASTLTIPGETEVSLIQNYFDKNHAYRNGQTQLNERALVYVDDEWSPYADGFSNDVGILYNDRTLIKDDDTTTADDYKARLLHNYEWISLYAHSNSNQHGFASSSGHSTVFNTDISQVDPVAQFYNLYACSAAKYSDSLSGGYIGGHYIFAETYGINAVSSTKIGGMQGCSDFYTPLSYGSSIGKAFQLWFEIYAESSSYSRAWYYGMTILGDPTLVPRM